MFILTKLFILLHKRVYEASALYKKHQIDFKEFMNYILSAEIGMLLIKEDQSVSFDDAGKILQETSPLGVLLYPESKEADYQELTQEEQ